MLDSEKRSKRLWLLKLTTYYYM